MHNNDEIRNYISYNQEEGTFIWIKSPSKKTKEGSKAGYTRPDGYVSIRFRGYNLVAHRVAWFLTYGAWPELSLDHVNRVRSDNRINNLRQVTHRENHSNRASFNYGASKHVGGRWKAQIRINNRAKHLGLFDTEQEAQEAYKRKLEEINQ